MSRRPDFPAPETDNSEQRDDGQAQDVAQDARLRATDLYEASEHGGRPNIGAVLPDDVPDLIDKMNDMVASGRIDNDAFAGEPMHDDEEDLLGDTDPDEDEDVWDRDFRPPNGGA